MKRELLIGSGLLGMIAVGGIALAATDGGDPMRADANGDGNLTRTELMAALDKRFAELDRNGDGKITKDEVEAAREARFEQHFKDMDTDGNGQISMAEMKAAHAARMEKWHDRMGRDDGPGGDMPDMGGGRGHHRGMGHGGMKGHGGGLMAMLDASKDGAITKAEFEAKPIAMFEKADTNHDGVVTQAEREAARDAMRGKWRDRMGDMPPPPQPPSN